MGDQTASDMDGGWKQIIEDYLEEFFRFFFPRIHASINFNAKYHFLDKELAKLMVDTESGDRRVDKLIQVQWIDGSVEWILLHVEVQAQRDVDFARRMYVYHYRIWDRYKQPVISLALLADGNPNFRPNHFHRERAGCRLDFRFPIVKLLDYKTEEEMAADPSPFALASLVQLRKIQAGKDVQQRYQFKLAFIRELYSRNYTRDDIIKLFRFMDYILRLPEDLAIQFRQDLESFEEELKMPYVTSVERLAKQEGIEQGIEQGIERGIERGSLQSSRELLLQTIQVRFGQIPEELRVSINACTSTENLSNFHRQALLAKSIDELPRQLT
jgi:hypothetical protein